MAAIVKTGPLFFQGIVSCRLGATRVSAAGGAPSPATAIRSSHFDWPRWPDNTLNLRANKQTAHTCPAFNNHGVTCQSEM